MFNWSFSIDTLGFACVYPLAGLLVCFDSLFPTFSYNFWILFHLLQLYFLTQVLFNNLLKTFLIPLILF